MEFTPALLQLAESRRVIDVCLRNSHDSPPEPELPLCRYRE